MLLEQMHARRLGMLGGILLAFVGSTESARALAPLDLEAGKEAFSAGRYEDAFSLLEPRAAAGDAVAQFLVGLMLRDGLGIPRNIAEAKRWLTRAAEQGYEGAGFVLGEIEFGGRVGLRASQPHTTPGPLRTRTRPGPRRCARRRTGTGASTQTCTRTEASRRTRDDQARLPPADGRTADGPRELARGRREPGATAARNTISPDSTRAGATRHAIFRRRSPGIAKQRDRDTSPRRCSLPISLRRASLCRRTSLRPRVGIAPRP